MDRGQDADHTGRMPAASPPSSVAVVPRDDLLAQIETRFERGRLVSLVGPPGVGKTWLARRLVDVAPSGRFIDLRRAETDAEVWPVCAATLGLPEDGDGPSAAVALLAERGPATLVLDNAEHVKAGTSAFVELVRELTPEHRILVTSREPLGLAGESTVGVSPLDENDGARLLLRRAEDAGVDPLPSIDEARALAAGLDGLPLALELAAPRLRVLSPAELLKELDDRFGVLAPTGASRSLEAAIASSWERLDDEERACARVLWTFRGGMPREAAEALLAPLGGRPLDRLQALVDRSLLTVARHQQTTRYDFLQSIWTFIGARIDDEERTRLWTRHAEVIADWAQARIRERTRAAFVVLAAEVDNLLAAAARVGEQQPALGVRVALALDELTTAGRGGWHHGVLLGSAAGWAERVGAGARAQILAARARYRFFSGAYQDVAADAEAAMACADEAGDGYSRGKARFAQALLAAAVGDVAEVDAALKEVAAAYEAVGDEALLAKDLSRVALELARHGHVEAAERCLAKARPLDGELAASTLPAAEGFIHLARGAPRLALPRFDEGRRVAEAAGFELERIPSEIGRAVTLQLLGEPAAAARGAGEAALLSEAAGSATAAALCAVVGAQAAFLARLDGVADALDRAAAVAERYDVAELRELVAVTRALIALAEGMDADTAGLRPAAQALIDGLALRVVEGGGAGAVDPVAPWEDAFGSRQIGALLAVMAEQVHARAGGAEPPAPTLALTADASRLDGPDGRVDLATRPVLRRVILALVDTHQAAPGEAVTHEVLIARGWPDERILPDAARRRLQVSISMLRRLGLKQVIETVPEGYRLLPSTRLGALG
jgi:predicted ATPase